MMRKCVRCGADMLESCAVRQSDNACGLVIVDSEKLFAHTLGKVRAAVCPECGEISFYLEEREKVRKAI